MAPPPAGGGGGGGDGASQTAAAAAGAAPSAGVSIDAIKAHKAQLAAACASLRAHREAREANLNPQRPDEASLGRLDSSVKKNGAFIKKLRALGADNGRALLVEAARLNLSKYVSEAVGALAEAPMKVADAPALLDMAAALHARYADFAPALGPALAKAAAGGGKGGTDEEQRAAARRQRGPLRLLPELIAAGVLSDAGPYLGAIRGLASSLDFTKAPDSSLTAATLLGGAIKAAGPLLLGLAAPQDGAAGPPATTAVAAAAHDGAGSGGGSAAAAAAAAAGAAAAASTPLPQELLRAEDLSGLPPDLAAAVGELQRQQQALDAELKQRYQLPSEQRALLVKMFDYAFDCSCAGLVEAHKALLALDKDNARTLATKGELPEAAASEYEAQRRAYEALHRGVAAMSEGLGGRPLPELAEDAFTRLGAAAGGGGGSAGGAGGGGHEDGAGGEGAVEHVFEDPEVRAFYEQLPDIWSLVPTVLLRDATRPRASSSSGDAAAAAAAAEGGGGGGAKAGEGAAPEAAAAAAAAEEDKGASKPAAAAAAAGDTGAAAAEAAADAEAEPPDAAGPDPGGPGPSGPDLVLARLPSCVSRDLADELAVNFLYANSKGARKRLARALGDVPRGSLQLLPYWARVAATVSQAYPEVGAAVVSAVEAEFDALVAKKDLTRAGEEPRLRAARYLAELAKFRLAPPSSPLLRLKALLDDFTGPHVEAGAALVESAGRFLLRLPESRVRMDNLLGVMMRLRNARNLDSRQTNAIDNAYFACRPPDKAASRRRKRSHMQEYIHHLIFERLGDATIVEVLKKLMRLPWGEAEPYLLKCLLKVVRVRFQHIALIASLAGGLAQHHDSLGVGLVDLVLEDMRWGLDHPFAGNYQQRLAQVRLLGESYNYMLLDSRAVFDVLYMLIGYGHDSEASALRLDPPDDFFRLRMVIVLLNTCGSYFNKGAAKRRLDRFLTFLQAYVLAKHTMPLDVEADLQDMLDVLRPSLPRHACYAEAAAAVAEVLAREAAASASGLEPIDEDEEDDDEEEEEEEAKASSEDDDDDDEEGLLLVDEYDRGEGGAGGGAPLDDEFEREYAALMQECQGRPAASSHAPAAAAAPVLLQQPPPQQQQPPGRHLEEEEEEGGAPLLLAAPEVTFKMLMKRGGRDDRSRELHIPADAAIAARLLATKECEEAERSAIKALVLQANQREEAEERAAAAAAAAAAARGAGYGGRGGGGRGGGGGGQLYRRAQRQGGGRGGRGGQQQQQQQQGPQLTLSRHVTQLTGRGGGGRS